MLNKSARELSLAGWVLAVASLACALAVTIGVGQWAVTAIDSSTFRSWRNVLIYVLAVPGFAVAVLSFVVGQRLLARLGIRVSRADNAGPPTSRRS